MIYCVNVYFINMCSKYNIYNQSRSMETNMIHNDNMQHYHDSICNKCNEGNEQDSALPLLSDVATEYCTNYHNESNNIQPLKGNVLELLICNVKVNFSKLLDQVLSFVGEGIPQVEVITFVNVVLEVFERIIFIFSVIFDSCLILFYPLLALCGVITRIMINKDNQINGNTNIITSLIQHYHSYRTMD